MALLELAARAAGAGFVSSRVRFERALQGPQALQFGVGFGPGHPEEAYRLGQPAPGRGLAEPGLDRGQPHRVGGQGGVGVVSGGGQVAVGLGGDGPQRPQHRRRPPPRWLGGIEERPEHPGLPAGRPEQLLLDAEGAGLAPVDLREDRGGGRRGGIGPPPGEGVQHRAQPVEVAGAVVLVGPHQPDGAAELGVGLPDVGPRHRGAVGLVPARGEDIAERDVGEVDAVSVGHPTTDPAVEEPGGLEVDRVDRHLVALLKDRHGLIECRLHRRPGIPGAGIVGGGVAGGLRSRLEDEDARVGRATQQRARGEPAQPTRRTSQDPPDLHVATPPADRCADGVQRQRPPVLGAVQASQICSEDPDEGQVGIQVDLVGLDLLGGDPVGERPGASGQRGEVDHLLADHGQGGFAPDDLVDDVVEHRREAAIPVRVDDGGQRLDHVGPGADTVGPEVVSDQDGQETIGHGGLHDGDGSVTVSRAGDSSSGRRARSPGWTPVTVWFRPAGPRSRRGPRPCPGSGPGR